MSTVKYDNPIFRQLLRRFILKTVVKTSVLIERIGNGKDEATASAIAEQMNQGSSKSAKIVKIFHD